jgi:hypothetical protein
MWSGPFNPTLGELQEADKHMTKALTHEQSAEALEAFEAHECARVPQRQRAACPLLQTAIVEDLPDGVRLRFAAGAAVHDLALLMRCHLAFARARGFSNVPDCPLYLPGVDINEVADGSAIDVVSQRHGGAAEIRRRAHQETGR